MPNNCDPCREVRIENVAMSICNDMKNMSKRIGITQSEVIKPILQKILNAYPEHMRSAKLCEPTKEIRVRGVSRQVKIELQNLADNLGLPLSQFLEVKFSEELRATPAHMKEPLHDAA